MRAVVGHQRGGERRGDEMLGDDDHDRAGGAPAGRIVLVRALDVAAAERERAHDGVRAFPGHLAGGLHDHASRRRRRRLEDSAQPPDELLRGVRRCSERHRERHGRIVGHAALELAHEALLPGWRIMQDDGGLEAELQGGRGAPQRRSGRVDPEHAPILASVRAAKSRFHKAGPSTGVAPEPGEEAVQGQTGR
ncbi:hypothetical protein OB08_14670 [Microbacterium sp. HJ5]